MLKSSWEISKGGWTLYAKNWREFVRFLIILILPALFLTIVNSPSLSFPKLPLVGNLAVLAIFIASLALAFWAASALIRAVIAAGHSQPIDWKKIYLRPSNLVWLIVWASLVVGLVSFGGNLLLVILILILAAIFNFIFYAVIFENAGGFGALRASYALVAGRGGAMLWRWVVSAVVLAIFIFVISYILTFVIRLLPLPIFLELFLAKLIPSLAKAAIIPLLAGSTLILYQSAKQNPVGQQVTTPPSQP